ncbi:ATP-dependent protease subunit HslV [Borreliella burgdorferi]|uniref:ATP-dependent protease subunit HslV n=5 Tax=Borreliella TaxID=64895 RepID=HSLV_BORBU|nr:MULTISPECIES: ATP-dependent protease subunit HslV [Borreliella]B7J1M4.1 RecName: Full=ATP-dependent protease subunit HslV [Borreliella burgdorferi ZS7]Q57209.1 RecName: Full=ATP-dependent protease subunit HslV [Borreliella burgdorferi B31]AGS66315.1 ATP-dependent protease subunit HslV [Borreliella burgdorferi CA382]EOA80429.1 ATP-dependent protease peptidase subunit [Borreliella burgdorferi CA8]AAA85619.1 HsLV [Borreliella burgdorferi]AAB51405.1 heat shock response protein [Borreliella bur
MSFKGTTVIAIKKNGKTVVAADGQVTFGHTVLKSNAIKIRKLLNGKILAGFAGSTSDAITLFEKFEEKIKAKGDGLIDIKRAAVDLAKDWRSDKILHKLEAMMLVADSNNILLISGTGDVVEPEEDVISIGSGGNYAYSAALAYMENKKLSAFEVALRSLKIAARVCIYTNSNIVLEEIENE